MRKLCSILVFVIIDAFLYSATSIGQEPANKSYDFCRAYFETYIMRRKKVNPATVIPISHIIAVRGRDNGFWKNVLRELKKDNEISEIGCVRILGKMLAIDASAREVIRRERETGEISQWEPSVQLGPEVVSELVKRGKEADKFRIDHYAIALARAREPEARQFLLMVLQDDTNEDYISSAKFHAAVGLAHLGDPRGFEWLISNINNTSHTVSNALPSKISDATISTCCVATLCVLSGEQKLRTRQEWTDWWESVGKGDLPKRHVTFVDQVVDAEEPNKQ